jgi:hypothetical protein
MEQQKLPYHHDNTAVHRINTNSRYSSMKLSRTSSCVMCLKTKLTNIYRTSLLSSSGNWKTPMWVRNVPACQFMCTNTKYCLYNQLQASHTFTTGLSVLPSKFSTTYHLLASHFFKKLYFNSYIFIYFPPLVNFNA